MKIRMAGAVLASTGLVLAACGGDDSSSDATTPPAQSSAPAGTSAEGSPHDADVTFAQGMIGHHEQAIEMAEIALDPTRQAGAEVLDLANKVQAAQEPEIDTMTAWLEGWGEPVAMDTSDGHDMSSMEGMMSAEDMDALAAATGDGFDTMWLEMMIAHHEGAIAQARTVKAEGSNAEVRSLADEIITAQQAEIATMEDLLAG